ncbi:MAG: hypothetical protein Q8O30_01935 [Candidatus Omnitrophota bacterium]|nr:hypothetical protein [Candidatus Omnitrophota bacterium]
MIDNFAKKLEKEGKLAAQKALDDATLLVKNILEEAKLRNLQLELEL